MLVHTVKLYTIEELENVMPDILKICKEKQILSSNLKKCMENKNINVNELSNLLDLPYPTVRDWVNAVNYPRRDKLIKLADLFNIDVTELTEEHNKNIIPVLGTIPAGIPLEAIENIVDYEEIPLDWLKGDKEYFGLKIKGDSMSPFYNTGDTVIFQKVNNCESGSHCAVMVNGNDVTFKKIIKNETGIILQPLNKNYDPIFYTNEQIKELPINIIGIAKEIRRKLDFK